MRKLLLILPILLSACVTHDVVEHDYYWDACNAHTFNVYANPGLSEAFCYTTGDGEHGLLRRCDVDKDCPGEQVCRCVGDPMGCLVDFFVLRERNWFWGCVDLGSEAYPYEF